MLELAVGIAAATPIGMAVRQYVAVRETSQNLSDHYREKFYAAVNRLAENEDVQEEDLERISAYVRLMDHDRAFPIMLAAVTMTLRDLPQIERQRQTPRAYAADWIEMMFAFVQVVSYKRMFAGFLLRARFSQLLEPSLSLRAETALAQHLPSRVALV